jgi:hypothetical protein
LFAGFVKLFLCSIQLLFTVFKLFTGFFELFLAVLNALRCGI